MKVVPDETAESSERDNPRFVPPQVEELAGVFPQLEVTEFIGQGGMGAVYKARQNQLDRVVALKILPPDIGDDQAFAERFSREAKAMARLNHPGIVTIHDFGQAGGLFYFVMEFVDGVNLGELLRRKRISPKDALQIVPQICDALQYAHDQGIVHRDIKPENVLVDRQGRVKVADFGLAKLMGSIESPGGEPATPEPSSTLTAADRVMGTPQYMAPEQKDRPQEVDHRADVYSLGVVLYQLLTGELPQKPIEPPSRRVQVDVRLDDVVLRALQEDPDRRYQHVSSLKTWVENIASTPHLDPGRQQDNETGAPDRVPWQIWVVVAYLGFEGVFGNLSMIPQNPMAITWFAAKCLFITGLLRRWRWVFVMFLLEGAMHVFGFLAIAPFVTLLNLFLVALVFSAGEYYFPVLARGRLRKENAFPEVLRPALVGLAGLLLWGTLSSWLAPALFSITHAFAQEATTNERGSRPDFPARAKRPGKVSTKCGEQLALMNRGMEEGDMTPTGWKKGPVISGVACLWDRSTGHNSSSSLCLHKTVNRFFPIAQWSQMLPWQSDSATLAVGCQVKAEEATKAVVDVQFLGKEGDWLGHKWIAYIGATEAEDPPVTHDWKEYKGIAEVPLGTKHVVIALQIYGPGKLWFDDVQAEFLPKASSTGGNEQAIPDPVADVADIRSQDLAVAGNDHMRYFLIGPVENASAPEAGFKLLVVLPGGDGSADFNPFVCRILKNALGGDYLIAQPVAVKWQPDQPIVWPTRENRVEGQKFSTEEFVEAVIRDVQTRHKLDPRYLFTLSWSSGGPAAYAISLTEGTPITGSYIAMSVFNPKYQPPLDAAKGHAYFLDHSPSDRVCPFWMARKAENSLKEYGASVRLNTHQGGHGWQGDVYGRIRAGIDWLEGAVAKEAPDESSPE